MLRIENLKASAIRNLEVFDINFASGVNFFYGANGSGKTSILETLFILSRLKSFRSNKINNVIRHGEEKLQVFAKGSSKNQAFTIGVEKGKGITRVKFKGKYVQAVSDYAKNIPICLLTSEKQVLFKGTPKNRRHWLDWSLFHVEQNYLLVWKKYYRALRHRNALLKSDRAINSREIEGLEKVMEYEARKIDALRHQYILNINDLMNKTYLPSVLIGKTKIEYQSNHGLSESLAAMLAEKRQDDLKRGFTSLGPHRADVTFLYEELEVAQNLSSGQAKLYYAALISAQIADLKEKGTSSLVLVDDLDADLDEESSRKILKLLLMNETQTFVSLLVKKDYWLPKDNNKHAVFHVKQGKISQETA